MSFYFGIPAAGNSQTISPALRDRGLQYNRIPPSALKLVGLHSVTQPGYNAYTSVLPAAITATHSNQVTTVSSEGYPISLTIAQCFPIPQTTINFNFARPQINEQEQTILHELGAIRHHLDGRKAAMFTIPNCTPDIVKEVKKLPSVNFTTNSPIGSMNIQAYNQVITVIRIFSGFFRTHTYPAFQDSRTPAELNKVEIVDGKRKRWVGVEEGRNVRRRGVSGGRVETEEEEDTAMDLDDTTMPTIKLYQVKPNITENPWGPISRLPSGDGLYFPFVEDLAAPDEFAVYSVISRYFVKCLGETIIQQGIYLEYLKSAVGVFKDTKLGHILAHMATCILIALPAQCRVYPIFSDGVYDGCVVLGGLWALAYRGKLTYPVDGDHLRDAINDACSHSGSLKTIQYILAGPMATSANLKEIKSMWDLHNQCIAAHVSEPDKSTIIRNATNLQFQASRFKIHASSFDKLFSLISGESQFDDSSPINATALFSTDDIELALSCFGYEAPSFLIDNGTPVKLVRGAKIPPHISIKQVPLQRAVLDLKSLRVSREIRYAQPRLSTAYKYRQFSSGAEKGKLWDLLTKFVEVENLPFVEDVTPSFVALDEW